MSSGYIAAPYRLNLSGWDLPIALGVNSICGLFMVYCFLIFQEQQSFPRGLAAAFLLQVVVDFSLTLGGEALPVLGSGAWGGLLATASDVVQLGFVGCAIYWTLKGWRADLVDDRRILRWFIIGVQGALIFTVVFVETFLLVGSSAETAMGQSMIVYAIAALALGMLLVALRFDYVSLSYVIRKVAELTEEAEADEDVDSVLEVQSFHRQFRDGLIYREAGLTIAGLAKQLGVPEYRLRAFIHKQLGFRNFNAMLHQYRIEDACEALADPENSSVPVLTIALSVGYQSITPFNNAFRQLKGVTPSEYRKKNRKKTGKRDGKARSAGKALSGRAQGSAAASEPGATVQPAVQAETVAK
jgi:AraC-like DNA-binding protein